MTNCIDGSNAEETSSQPTKISNIEHQMLECKLVLLGDDGEPLKPSMNVATTKRKDTEVCLNACGQATEMELFPCLSDTFGTPNTVPKDIP